MPTASPTRLDAELTASAQRAAPGMSRSVAQQLSHWARIGRELERAPGVTIDAVREVLDGRASYDALDPRQQAVVRATWAERVETLRTNLRLDQVLADEGREIVELSPDGLVVVRGSDLDAA